MCIRDSHGAGRAEEFIHVHLLRKGVSDSDHGQDRHDGEGGVRGFCEVADPVLAEEPRPEIAPPDVYKRQS